MADLEKNFGEKEIFRRGGVIREYETLTRVEGESITACIRRFRFAGKEWHRVHREHLDQLLPLEYPEKASFRFGPEPEKESKKHGPILVEFRDIFVFFGFQKLMF